MAGTTLTRVLGELRPFRDDLLKGTFCLLISSPGRLFHPLVWMFVIDRVLGKGDTAWLVPALAIMVIVQGVSLFLGALQERFFERAGQRFLRDLRNRSFRKLNRQSAGYMQNQRVGDLNARVISDIQNIQSSIIGGMNTMLDELVGFIGVIIIILTINWMIGLFVIIPLMLTFLIVRHFNSMLKKLYQEASTILGQVSARLQDSLAGHAVVSAFGRRTAEAEAFQNEADRHFEKTMATVNLRTILFPTSFFVGFLTNVIMLGVGVRLVLDGQLTLGGLVAIRIYWWQLNSPMRTLATVNDLIQRALASSNRVYELLDAPEESPGPENPKTLDHAKQAIRFDDVSFCYDPSKPVLQNLSFSIEPESRVVLAGVSGGGKTTILNLLLRFYDPGHGRIFCGEIGLDEMTREHWRSFVAPVFQETFLFHSSIRDNLLYGKPDAGDAEIHDALAKANALTFVNETPQGLDTIVGERGIKLSGGQRQRLGIARAFLANPSILVMDEPTSSVEPESERVILESINELMKGRTVILTSHRVSLFQQSDRILLLAKGRIVEDGSHRELLSRGGLYARLYQSCEEAEMLEPSV